MAAEGAHDATELLVAWQNGDGDALGRLLPLVYDELHRLASRQLRRERPDHTLQATALVHEAYLRMVDQRRVNWQSSLQFVGVAAQMMRRILVDHARSRRYAKRGGGDRPVPLESVPEVAEAGERDLVEVDEALTRLAQLEPQLARIVELRFFGGLNNQEIGSLLGVSEPTVKRRWRTAKAWLHRYLSGDDPDAG